tara:strand:+ start:50282 stop:50443 length:162 start_codon:yes stop_codon:yes gene_type:complete
MGVSDSFSSIDKNSVKNKTELQLHEKKKHKIKLSKVSQKDIEKYQIKAYTFIM